MDDIKHIIQDVISNITNRKPEAQVKIQRVWQSIADKRILQHAMIAGIKDGTLLIHVDSPAWLYQLNLQKRKMLEQFKDEVPGLIENISFKIGKIK